MIWKILIIVDVVATAWCVLGVIENTRTLGIILNIIEWAVKQVKGDQE